MKRRGAILEIVLTPTFTTAVVLGLVLITLLRAIYGIGSSLDYEMQFYATDMGLLVDGAYSVPPDVNFAVNYSKILPNFTFSFNPTLIAVSAKDVKKNKTFWFTEDSKYRFAYSTIKNPAVLTLTRTGKNIAVQNSSEPVNLNILFCKPYQGIALNDVLLKSSPETELLAGFFKSWNPDMFGKGSGGIIGFGTTSADVIKIFATHTSASARLACLMANAVAERFSEVPVAIIPVNIAYLSENDPKSMLRLNVPSVYVEIPNALLIEQREIANVLYKEGVEKYGVV